MSLYYNNFKYLNINSIDQGLIVSSFEPDDGFMDSFLSMEAIQEDYFDGTKKFDYGSKYSTTAIINICVIKRDGTDFSLSDFRSLAKWLTGARVNSWLDVGPEKDDVKYSFLGRVTNLQQRKMDGRVIGLLIEFTSVSPWAYSEEQHFEFVIGQALSIDENGVVIKSAYGSALLNVDEDGVLYNSASDENSYFNITDTSVAYIDTAVRTYIDNQSDDLYTYINLDIDYTNDNCDYISIKNTTLDEETIIGGMGDNEKVTLSAKQFITSSKANKVFGDDFNFVWPRLAPGINNFIVDGNKMGNIQFSYRYPMKVGDCSMDLETSGNSINYCD
jgi:hypothetical protein